MHHVLFPLPRHHLRCSSVAAARAAVGSTAQRRPHTALTAFVCVGLLKYHLSEVSEIMSMLTEIRRNSGVARRLAIFAVKKLRRFEREETRTV